MICSLDKTFCTYYEDCANSHTNGGDCDRPLTPEISQRASMLRLFVSTFAEKPDCHQPTQETDEH